ncbi:N-acetylmuramoyl-L-alanine amidase family protein [Clostridium perfringens]
MRGIALMALIFMSTSLVDVNLVNAEVLKEEKNINSKYELSHDNYVDLESKMYIDTPNNGDDLKEDILSVTGWSLNASGVKEVQVYLDGKRMDNAKIGLERPDVNAAFPGYKGGSNSGFESKVDLSNIPSGIRVLKIISVGNDGSEVVQTREVKVTKKEPKMYIDTPNNGDDLKEDILNVRGWSLNSSGVKEVQVYLDGKRMDNAKIGLERPDVNAAFPGYKGGSNSGFESKVDLSNIPSGIRVLKIISVGNDGSEVVQTREVKVIKKEPKIYIDAPNNGDNLKEDILNVRGWSLNASGVKEVQVYLDGKRMDNAKIGLERPDVNAAFPGYKGGSNSGFESKVDLSNIPSGIRVLKIISVGNDGSEVVQTREVKVTKKEPKIYIDAPNNGDDLKEDILNVRGWSLNALGVKEVQVYLDGKRMDNAKIGLERPDVSAAFPGYKGGSNSGFESKVDLSNIPSGIRVLKIISVGNDGSEVVQTREVKVTKKEPKIYIDAPNNGDDLKEDILNVRGWSLNASGVKEVQVYLDGKRMDNAKIGLERPDVNAAFPGYKGGSNSGFESKVDLSNIPSGTRVLKIISVGNDGSEVVQTREILIRKSKLIVVDPGHNYGGDYGSESKFDGITYKETELNMLVALKLRDELQKRGYSVVLTRQVFERPMEDLYTSINNRVDLANSINADAFISIHHDSNNTIMAKGVTTFYSSWKSGLDNTDIVDGKDPNGYDWYDLKVDQTPTKEAIIGRSLAREIVNNMANDVNYYNRKEHDRNLGVIKKTNMPAVLVECGFISNPEEAKRAADPKNQQRIAESIANSVKNIIK